MEDLLTEFNGKLAVPAQAGHYFDIEVKPINGAKSFHISLARSKLNENPEADIALRIEVDLQSEQITANSRFDGRWYKDNVGNCSVTCPSEDEENVRVILKISDHVSLNNEAINILGRIHSYPIEAIRIGGDIKLIRRMDHRQIFPKLWPPSTTMSWHLHTIDFSNDIPIQFKPGHSMVITAHCFGDANGRFSINFKYAHNESILLHFNPRFGSSVVVRNTLSPTTTGPMYGQVWGLEERDGGFPFDFKKPFRLGFACREKDILIAVNGRVFCSYAYRDPEGNNRRPYKNLLSNIVGPKFYSRGGLGIKVTEIDHLQLTDPECNGFEKYTSLEGTE